MCGRGSKIPSMSCSLLNDYHLDTYNWNRSSLLQFWQGYSLCGDLPLCLDGEFLLGLPLLYRDGSLNALLGRLGGRWVVIILLLWSQGCLFVPLGLPPRLHIVLEPGFSLFPIAFFFSLTLPCGSVSLDSERENSNSWIPYVIRVFLAEFRRSCCTTFF